MIPRSYTFLILLLLSLAAHGHGEASYIDWIEPGSPAYVLLQQASTMASGQGWAASRLRDNKPLPQASARDYRNQLLDSPLLDADLKKKLQDALPDEMQSGSGDLAALEAKSAELKAKIDGIDAMVEQVMQAKRKNNYSPATNPQISVIYQYQYDYTALSGLRTVAGPNENGPMAAITLTESLSNFSASMQLFLLREPMFAGQAIDGPSGWYSEHNIGNNEDPWHFPVWGPINQGVGELYLKFDFDPDSFRAIQIEAGNITDPPLDPLICSSISGNQGSPYTARDSNPFFKGDNFLVYNLATENVDVAPGSRTFRGLAFQKSGAQGWWIFDSFRMEYAPTFGGMGSNTNAQYNGLMIYVPTYPPSSNNNGSQQQDVGFWYGANTLTGRLDLAHRNLPLLEDADIWFSWLIDQDEKDLVLQNGGLLPDIFNRDFSFGVSSQLFDTGQYNFEVASNHYFSRGPQYNGLITKDLTWDDTAMVFGISKPFAPFSLALNGANIGPHYIVGLRQGLWTVNSQYGDFFDSSVNDPRPGNAGKIAYQTMDYDSLNPSNNSRRVSANLSYASGWGSIGLNPGFDTEIEPSGPWIQTAHYLGNSWASRMDWFGVLFSNSGPDQPQGYTYNSNTIMNGIPLFNSQTQGKAYYKGQTVTTDYYGQPITKAPNQWNWQDAQNLAQPAVVENILLSQKGLGDPNLRADSIKTLNFLRGTWNLDLQALLDTPWPVSINGFSEIRAVSEQIGLASYSDKNLLSQQVSESYLTVGCSQMLTLQFYGGYENWLSNAGYFPLASYDRDLGWGFDLALSRYVSGLNFTLRNDFFAHNDQNYRARDWEGYDLNAYARLIF